MFFTKQGKVKVRFAKVFKALHGQTTKTQRFHFKEVKGRFRNFMRFDDTNHQYAMHVLDFYKIQYTLGNDAPRGGKVGDYIEVKLDKRKSFYKQHFEY